MLCNKIILRQNILNTSFSNHTQLIELNIKKICKTEYI